MIKQLTAMPRYEEYKDSGVEWLEEIPKHWDLSKLGSCLKSVSIKNRPDLPLLSITREKGVIQRNVEDQDENHNYIPDDLSNYKVLKRGQFGMNKMKAWQGSYGISDHTGIVSPAYFIFDFVKDIDPKFFHLAIRSRLYISYFGSASDGVRIGQWDLSKPRMREIPFLIPKLSEQIAIAAFLDRKTAQIDQAVAIKEKQIALLKECKQILIQNAVTRGLNSNVPMRDSGVEWIGEIPAHWDEINKIKYISSLKGRQGWQGLKAEEYTDEGPYVLSSAHFNDYIIYWEKCPRVSMERYLMDENIQLQVGDILLMKDGANMGKLALVDHLPGLACLNSHLLLFRPLRRGEMLFYDPKFMFYHMVNDGFQDYVKVNGTGATFLGVSQESIGNYPICLPPLEEQTAIVAHIEAESAKIDKAIAIQQQQIDKLKEYKVTLINSAVTGKIKVPELLEGRVTEVPMPEPVEGELVEDSVA